MRFTLLALTLAGCGGESGVTVFNNAPEALITSHMDGEEVPIGAELTLRGSVSDADDGAEELFATWLVDGEVVCEGVPEANGISTCVWSFGDQDVNVQLEGRDPSNGLGAARVTLVAGDLSAQLPVVTLTEPTDGEVFEEGDAIVFTAVVTDAVDAGPDIALTWTSDLAGVFSSERADSSGVAVVATAGLEVGSHLITVQATDTSGYVGTDAVAIVVDSCARPWYQDLDEDGFGSADQVIEQCDPPDGYVDNADDCDDLNSHVNPTQAEACDDGLDNNCDGRVDEGCLGTNCFEDDAIVGDLRYYQIAADIDATDATDAVGFYRDDYEFEAVGGTALAFHAWSLTFDTYVELYDQDCVLYDAAADGARDGNAFLQVRIPSDGIWTVLVTTTSSGETGDYVFEVIDDSIETGFNCTLDTDALDLLTSPYTETVALNLSNSDSDFGGGFYYDDIEYYSFYGDTVISDHVSGAFDPILNLYSPDCMLVTYDEDGLDGYNAQIVHTNERTGIYTLTPWAEWSGQTGSYIVTSSASW